MYYILCCNLSYINICWKIYNKSKDIDIGRELYADWPMTLQPFWTCNIYVYDEEFE